MQRFLLTLALALLGCSGASSSGAKPEGAVEPAVAPVEAEPVEAAPVEPAPARPAPQPPGPPTLRSGVDELPELEGQPRADILARFGEPTRAREFTMAECCTEFQIELYNTYPPDGGHAAVAIHEWTWAYDGYALTVWLHEQAGEWRVLETSRYSDDVEF